MKKEFLIHHFIHRNTAHIRKITTLMVAIQKTESLNCLKKFFPCILTEQQEIQEQVINHSLIFSCSYNFKIYMDLRNLDYTSENFLYAKRNGKIVRKICCPNQVFNKVVSIAMKKLSIEKGKSVNHEFRVQSILQQILDKLALIERKIKY